MAPVTRSAARNAASTTGTPINAHNAPTNSATTRPTHRFTTGPVRTVDDDPNLVLDINGLKEIIKDDEDLKLIKEALQDVPAANIGDVKTWVEDAELKAHVADVDAAPAELKNSLLSRSKSGIYDSIRSKKESGTSTEEANKTGDSPAAADK